MKITIIKRKLIARNNVLSLLLPKHFCDMLDSKKGSEVGIDYKDGNFIVIPNPRGG